MSAIVAKIGEMALVLMFLAFGIALLPTSPFTAFINALERIPYLDILNWFVPVSEIIAIGQAWLVAVALFYVVSLILSWVKAIR